MNRCLLAVLAAGLALACSPTPVLAQRGGAAGVEVIRDSTGARRAELDKMELKPFPAEAWEKVSKWSGGGEEGGNPLAGGAADGKPVLIFSWGSWHPASLRALNTAKQIAEKYREQGLIVVAVHHPSGFERAEKVLKDRGAEFVLAHDEKGEFRKALRIENDPDWYIIDRAGHLRYTAVSTASVDEACGEVVKETREQAGDLPRILRERAEQEARARGLTRDIRQDVELSSLPPVPPGYVQPSESAYEKVTWPKIDKQLGQEMGMIEQQTGRQMTPELNFAPEGYFPAAPTTQGRALVIYFWHPDLHMTYGRTMPQMDLLQQQNPRDLAVIGAMVPVEMLDRSRQQNQQQLDEERAEKLVKRYQSFVQSRSFRHALAADLSGSSLNSISGQQIQTIPIPGAMVVSTDGIIRWVGFTTGSDFRYAVDTVLANDPGVKARREADRKYIETRKR